MSLLVTFPMLTRDDIITRLPKLWSAIQNETVPTTRFFIEWYIILALLQHGKERELTSLLNRLLEFDLSTGSAISVLTIVMHVGRKVMSPMKRPFFESVLHRILPWFIHNNHMVRLFALYVYDNLWLRASTDPELKELSFPEGYANMAGFISQSHHNQKFVEKLKKEYFLNEFDPINDYSVQTIFSTLPQRSTISPDESISMYSFMNFDGQEGNIAFGEDHQVGILKETPRLPIIQATEAVLKDYQQKMDPWDMELLDQNLGEIRRKREVERRKTSFDVVVVASLIDRIPNMAGLCRTSEVFGATSLILPSLEFIDDPTFKNISLTSERWMDVQEVKPDDLSEYLQKMKQLDYRIIAVEQSSQSHSLLHYEFPTKCCLVLGSEREGVPAEILHFVDDCVEIPQFGMIRSLNVHVSGSIILWEARRQGAIERNLTVKK